MQRSAPSPGYAGYFPASGEEFDLAPCFAYLDEVAVRVADVCPYLAAVVFRLREELRSLGRPLLVRLCDVGDPDVHERADAIGIWRDGQGHCWLVVGRASAVVENQPGVGDPQDHGVARE